jgi:hypothetical protein
MCIVRATAPKRSMPALARICSIMDKIR